MLRRRGREEKEPEEAVPAARLAARAGGIAFDEETARRFQEATGGADIKSEDKSFHMRAGDGRVWAVASSGTIGREYEALRQIAAAGAPTVLGGALATVSHLGRPTEAYPMVWLSGAISSKSQNQRFLATLAACRANPATLGCLTVLDAASDVIDVQDFQALIDPTSGLIYVNDPRGVSRAGAGGVMKTRLAQWRAAMAGPAPAAPAQVAVPGPTPGRAAAEDLSFLEVNWDAAFAARARAGEVWSLGQDELAHAFSEHEIARMGRIGERNLRDSSGRTWDLLHTRETAPPIYYFRRT